MSHFAHDYLLKTIQNAAPVVVKAADLPYAPQPPHTFHVVVMPAGQQAFGDVFLQNVPGVSVTEMNRARDIIREACIVEQKRSPDTEHKAALGSLMANYQSTHARHFAVSFDHMFIQPILRDGLEQLEFVRQMPAVDMQNTIPTQGTYDAQELYRFLDGLNQQHALPR